MQICWRHIRIWWITFLVICAIFLALHLLYRPSSLPSKKDQVWYLQPSHLPHNEVVQNPYLNQSKFLVSDSSLCHNLPQDKITVVMFFFSMFETHEARAIAREFWAGSRTEGNIHFTTMFIMGRPNVPPDGQASAWEQIHEEQRKFNDLIVLDMEEAYERLTEKTMALVSWAFRHCRDADYIMKSDDDVVIYLPRMAQLVPTWRRTRFYGGLCHLAKRTERGGSKWALTEEQFPDDHFPPYCAGTGYLISGDLLAPVYLASFHVPSFTFEDVYFGLLVRHSGRGVWMRRVESFSNYPIRRRGAPAAADPCVHGRAAIVHGIPVDERRQYLSTLLRRQKAGHNKCT